MPASGPLLMSAEATPSRGHERVLVNGREVLAPVAPDAPDQGANRILARGRAPMKVAPATPPEDEADIQVTPLSPPQAGPPPRQGGGYAGPSMGMRDYDQELGARLEQSVGAQQEMARLEQERAVRQLQMQEEEAREREAINQREQAALAANQADADRIRQEVASGKIDSNGWWNSKSTGGKVLASVGLLLSGFASGLTGQPNYAIQTMNKAIDDDIESQKADLGKKQTLLQKYIDQGNSIRDSMKLTRAELKDRFVAMAERESTRFSALAANPKLQATLAKERAEALKEREGVYQDRAKIGMEQAKFAREMAAAGGGEVSPGWAESIPLNPSEREKFRDAIGTASAMTAGLRELKGLVTRHGKQKFDTEAAGRMAILKSDFVGLAARAEGAGGMNKETRRELEKRIGELQGRPELWNNTLAKIEQLIKDSERRVVADANARGIYPSQRQSTQAAQSGVVTIPKQR